jgi:hypothetical protein
LVVLTCHCGEYTVNIWVIYKDIYIYG